MYEQFITQKKYYLVKHLSGTFYSTPEKKIPFKILERISNRIVNEVVSVNRVVYDITSKPPGTIEWE